MKEYKTIKDIYRDFRTPRINKIYLRMIILLSRIGG